MIKKLLLTLCFVGCAHPVGMTFVSENTRPFLIKKTTKDLVSKNLEVFELVEELKDIFCIGKDKTEANKTAWDLMNEIGYKWDKVCDLGHKLSDLLVDDNKINDLNDLLNENGNSLRKCLNIVVFGDDRDEGENYKLIKDDIIKDYKPAPKAEVIKNLGGKVAGPSDLIAYFNKLNKG
jgi:hypothetical protein